MPAPPTNLGTTEYAVGAGWVLRLGTFCVVCQRVVGEIHPVACQARRPGPRDEPTMDRWA